MIDERVSNHPTLVAAIVYAAVVTAIVSVGFALLDLFDLFWFGQAGVPLWIFVVGQALLFVGLILEYRYDHGE
ncbi:MAG: hypothetical protein ABEJ86_05010 [Halococcoides sp.]